MYTSSLSSQLVAIEEAHEQLRAQLQSVIQVTYVRPVTIIALFSQSQYLKLCTSCLPQVSQPALVSLCASTHWSFFPSKLQPPCSSSFQRQNEQDDRISLLQASLDACIQSQAIFTSLHSLIPTLVASLTFNICATTTLTRGPDSICHRHHLTSRAGSLAWEAQGALIN